jgi:hypothetical protein
MCSFYVTGVFFLIARIALTVRGRLQSSWWCFVLSPNRTLNTNPGIHMTKERIRIIGVILLISLLDLALSSRVAANPQVDSAIEDCTEESQNVPRGFECKEFWIERNVGSNGKSRATYVPSQQFRPYGIAVPGLTFIDGRGDASYVDEAKVNAFGQVYASKGAQRSGRGFLSATPYIKPFLLAGFSDQWSRLLYVGPTVGVSPAGSQNLVSRLAVLYGFSIGVQISDNLFIAYTAGGFSDPEVKRLRYPFAIGSDFPTSTTRRDGSLQASVENSLLVVPVESTVGWYTGSGFTIVYRFF